MDRRRTVPRSPGDTGYKQVGTELDSGFLDRPHGEHLGGQLGFVVGQALTVEQVALDPGTAYLLNGLLAARRNRALGIQVGVENERPTGSFTALGPAQHTDSVDAVDGDMLKPCVDSGVLQPLGDRVPRGAFMTGIVGQVANFEAKID